MSPGSISSRSSGICSTGALGQRGAAAPAASDAASALAAAVPRRRRRADIFHRQIEREGAAVAGRAAQLDFAAEQVRKFAADGEAQAGAAVFAAGAGVGLLERLEDDLLLLQRNADAGVGHFEGDDGRRLVEHRMIRAPAADRGRHVQPHAAVLGELEGVRQQVLEHLLQALGVGGDAARRDAGSISTSNASCRLSASWRNGRAIASSRLASEDLLGVHRDGAGFDLRQVENVADQVRAGRCRRRGWCARTRPAWRDRLPSGLSRELLAEDQDASSAACAARATCWRGIRTCTSR